MTAPVGARASCGAAGAGSVPASSPPRFRWRLAALAAGRRGFTPGGHTLFLVGVSALAAALVLAREVTHGPALHWDALNYLAVARNLLAGEGFLNYDSSPYILWPPLWPLLLAAAGFGVLDPLRVVGPLNAVILGLTVFVAGRYLHRRLESRFLAVWAPAVLALSLPLTDLAWWALSEPLFVLLATLALVSTDDFLRGGGGRRSSPVLAAVAASLALQTRYPGIAVVGAVAVALLFRRGDPLRARARRSLAVVFVGVAPAALWLFRNVRLSGEITGHEDGGSVFAPDSLRGILGGFARWARFEWDLPEMLPLALLAAVVAVLAARSEARARAAGAGGRNRRGWRPVALFGGFGLAYAAGLAAVGPLFHGAFEPRYLDVVFLPCALAAVFALDRLLGSERERRRFGDFSGRRLFGVPPDAGAPAPTRLTVFLMAALTVWAAGQSALQARAIAHANSADPAVERAYNLAPWNRIESLAHLREHPEAETVFTNLPPIHRIAIHHARGGRGTVRGMPLREGEGVGAGEDADAGAGRNGDAAPLPLPQDRLRAFFSRAPEGALVLWLGEWSSEHFYDYGRAALRLVPGLEPVAEFADGAVFRVARAAAPGPDPWRAAYESAAPSGTGADPAGFEVRWGTPALRGFEGAALLYLREPCDEAQLQARFFLHLWPEAAGHLPAARREHRFDNRDFRFEEHGVVLDRASPSPKCVAIVPLPGYPVRRVRTGQWTAAAGELWAAEPAPPSPR